MARNKIGLNFDDWQEYMAKLDKLGDMSLMEKGVEEALVESKKHINPLIEKAVVKAKLPAKGKYSTGDTKASLDTDMGVEWEAMTGSVKIGFDFSESGLKSILLMQGTPKMKPVSGLKSAIYGTKTQKEIGEIQEKVLSDLIRKVMEG